MHLGQPLTAWILAAFLFAGHTSLRPPNPCLPQKARGVHLGAGGVGIEVRQPQVQPDGRLGERDGFAPLDCHDALDVVALRSPNQPDTFNRLIGKRTPIPRPFQLQGPNGVAIGECDALPIR